MTFLLKKYMDNELQVLKNIDNNESVTQRDIAKHTGMSLGAVNILIKRLVKKGLIKIEKLSPKSIKYFLTPSGLKEKTIRTYEYIKISYNYINEIDNTIRQFINETQNESKNKILLFGEKDVIYEILIKNLNEFKRSFKRCKSIQEINDSLNEKAHSDKSDKMVIAWEIEGCRKFDDKKIEYINLMEKL